MSQYPSNTTSGGNPSHRLDWLTAQLVAGRERDFMELVGGVWEPCLPRWGYKYGYVHPTSKATIYSTQWHNDAAPIAVLSGACLAELAFALGVANAYALVHVLSPEITGATRVDLAIDYDDEGQAARDVSVAAEIGRVETTAQKITVVRSSGPTGGMTTYFGSRSSPKFVRVYEKKDRDGEKVHLSRTEIELKKSAAQVVYQTYLSRPPYPTLKDVWSIIQQCVRRFDVKRWDDLASGGGGFIMPARPQSLLAGKDWLARQVVPSLRRDYKMRGWEASLLAWLVNEVTAGEKNGLRPEQAEGTDRDF